MKKVKKELKQKCLTFSAAFAVILIALIPVSEAAIAVRFMSPDGLTELKTGSIESTKDLIEKKVEVVDAAAPTWAKPMLRVSITNSDKYSIHSIYVIPCIDENFNLLGPSECVNKWKLLGKSPIQSQTGLIYEQSWNDVSNAGDPARGGLDNYPGQEARLLTLMLLQDAITGKKKWVGHWDVMVRDSRDGERDAAGNIVKEPFRNVYNGDNNLQAIDLHIDDAANLNLVENYVKNTNTIPNGWVKKAVLRKITKDPGVDVSSLNSISLGADTQPKDFDVRKTGGFSADTSLLTKDFSILFPATAGHVANAATFTQKPVPVCGDGKIDADAGEKIADCCRDSKAGCPDENGKKMTCVFNKNADPKTDPGRCIDLSGIGLTGHFENIEFESCEKRHKNSVNFEVTGTPPGFTVEEAWIIFAGEPKVTKVVYDGGTKLGPKDKCKSKDRCTVTYEVDENSRSPPKTIPLPKPKDSTIGRWVSEFTIDKLRNCVQGPGEWTFPKNNLSVRVKQVDGKIVELNTTLSNDITITQDAKTMKEIFAETQVEFERIFGELKDGMAEGKAIIKDCIEIIKESVEIARWMAYASVGTSIAGLIDWGASKLGQIRDWWKGDKGGNAPKVGSGTKPNEPTATDTTSLKQQIRDVFKDVAGGDPLQTEIDTIAAKKPVDTNAIRQEVNSILNPTNNKLSGAATARQQPQPAAGGEGPIGPQPAPPSNGGTTGGGSTQAAGGGQPPSTGGGTTQPASRSIESSTSLVKVSVPTGGGSVLNGGDIQNNLQNPNWWHNHVNDIKSMVQQGTIDPSGANRVLARDWNIANGLGYSLYNPVADFKLPTLSGGATLSGDTKVPKPSYTNPARFYSLDDATPAQGPEKKASGGAVSGAAGEVAGQTQNFFLGAQQGAVSAMAQAVAAFGSTLTGFTGAAQSLCDVGKMIIQLNINIAQIMMNFEQFRLCMEFSLAQMNSGVCNGDPDATDPNSAINAANNCVSRISSCNSHLTDAGNAVDKLTSDLGRTSDDLNKRVPKEAVGLGVQAYDTKANKINFAGGMCGTDQLLMKYPASVCTKAELKMAKTGQVGTDIQEISASANDIKNKLSSLQTEANRLPTGSSWPPDVENIVDPTQKSNQKNAIANSITGSIKAIIVSANVIAAKPSAAGSIANLAKDIIREAETIDKIAANGIAASQLSSTQLISSVGIMKDKVGTIESSVSSSQLGKPLDVTKSFVNPKDGYAIPAASIFNIGSPPDGNYEFYFTCTASNTKQDQFSIMYVSDCSKLPGRSIVDKPVAKSGCPGGKPWLDGTPKMGVEITGIKNERGVKTGLNYNKDGACAYKVNSKKLTVEFKHADDPTDAIKTCYFDEGFYRAETEIKPAETSHTWHYLTAGEDTATYRCIDAKGIEEKAKINLIVDESWSDAQIETDDTIQLPDKTPSPTPTPQQPTTDANLFNTETPTAGNAFAVNTNIPVVISGSGQRSGTTLTIEYDLGGGSWQQEGTAAVDATGSFRYTFTGDKIKFPIEGDKIIKIKVTSSDNKVLEKSIAIKVYSQGDSRLNALQITGVVAVVDGAEVALGAIPQNKPFKIKVKGTGGSGQITLNSAIGSETKTKTAASPANGIFDITTDSGHSGISNIGAVPLTIKVETNDGKSVARNEQVVVVALSTSQSIQTASPLLSPSPSVSPPTTTAFNMRKVDNFVYDPQKEFSWTKLEGADAYVIYGGNALNTENDISSNNPWLSDYIASQTVEFSPKQKPPAGCCKYFVIKALKLDSEDKIIDKTKSSVWSSSTNPS